MINNIWVEELRPKTLSEVIGNELVIKILRGYVASGNIPHLLFSGSPGIGKTTVALALAEELYGSSKSHFKEMNASVTPETPILVRINGVIKRINFDILSSIYYKDDDLKYVYPTDLEILSIDKNTLKVEFKYVLNISRHKIDKIAEIKYNGGFIRTTLNHSVMVFDEYGNIIKKNMSDLKIGDYLISFCSLINSDKVNKLDMNIFKSDEYLHPPNGHSIKNPKLNILPEEIVVDKDFCWLIGSYIAEGCVNFNKYGSSGKLIFTYAYPKEKYIAERTAKILKEKFGLSSEFILIKSGYSNEYSGIQVVICSTQLAKYVAYNFYDNKVKKKSSHTIHVPEFIFNLPLEYRIEYLKGYMGDANGIWEEHLRYSSVSENCLIDTAWLGRICNIQTSLFPLTCGFTWKIPKFKYLRSELLPALPIFKLLEKIEPKYNWKYDLRHSLYAKKCKTISKTQIRTIFDKINDTSKQFSYLDKLSKSNLFVVQITDIKVKEYNNIVYDVSVPNSEMFWGGTTPVLLHNSDERGIDVVRGKIKEIAEKASDKIIFLDECDALTNDAQNALRRTIEKYSSQTRFILSCNYRHKIIEPIQSRMTCFHFSPLTNPEMNILIDRTCAKKSIVVPPEIREILFRYAKGDARRIINPLQSASMLGNTITKEAIQVFTQTPDLDTARLIINTTISGDFISSREMLLNMFINKGFDCELICETILEVVKDAKFTEDKNHNNRLIATINAIVANHSHYMNSSNPIIEFSGILAKISMIQSINSVEQVI